MKILLILDAMLPDPRQGEAERVVWYLAKELDRLGHRVSLLAHRGSCCDFAHIIYRDPAQTIESQIPKDIDIVHLHLRHDSLPQISKPHIITQYLSAPTTVDNARTVYLSQSHARRCGSSQFVYSGLDWSEFSKVNLKSSRKHYHLLATRAAERECDLQEAVEIIRSVEGAKLKVMGKSRFGGSIDARIALSTRVRFCRSLQAKSRAAVQLASKGLIFNARYEEPFGLDLIESLFFGAPIFATPVGSLPEIVRCDFGFLSDDLQLIARAMQQADFSPYRCHQYAADCFNSQIMTAQYLKKYDAILSNNTLQ